jgi:uncharacterized membrane protein YfcA
MWEHYKKTFKSVQAAIAIATVVIYFALGHLPIVTAVFFLVMQLGSVAGAAWGARLRHKILQH